MSNYTNYGEEWQKEVAKLPKKAIIEIAAKIGQEKARLEVLVDFRDDCRRYLMGVNAHEVTVEDALESLGYGRNGFG